MSDVIVSGTLILNGDLEATGNVTVTSSGLIVPIPDSAYMAAYHSCPSDTYITANGCSRVIRSTSGDIDISGSVNGTAQGFNPGTGPGCNSVLIDNLGHDIDGYGATHAGIGGMYPDPGTIAVWMDEVTLDTDDVYYRFVRLSAMPVTPSSVAMNVNGGTSQNYGTDFTVSGTVLTWLGTPLDGLLAVGDIVRIMYWGDSAQIVPAPKPPYGSYKAPTSLGSGSYDAHGGGGIKFDARGGTVSLNGTVIMDGEDGVPGTGSGGGSGGSIWAVGWAVDGTGTLSSSGGAKDGTYSGGGGGGYVSLWYEHKFGFDGTEIVDGIDGGQDGVTYTNRIEPFFEEKFTGGILNRKWWEVVREPVRLENFVRFDSSQDEFSDPAIQSLFSISGRNIRADCDYLALSSPEPNLFSAEYLLWADDQNWVGVARKKDHLFGVYSAAGVTGQVTVAFPSSSVSMRIAKTDSTFMWQYCDCTNLYTIGSEVLPSLERLPFKVRLGLNKQTSDAAVDMITLSPTDIANGYVTLSGPPSDESAVALNLISGGPQYYGTDFRVSGQQLLWDGTLALQYLLAAGDTLRVQYPVDQSSNAISCGFDNFRVFDGILAGIEASEPIVYVDPVNGSDTSSGQQLDPLQNLFVATAWAKRNGIVVLYDGTYNPSEIWKKNLTIRGAAGASAVITSAGVLDSTGSGWETNGLSFVSCQGRAENLVFTGGPVGVRGWDTENLQVFECDFDTTTAVQLAYYDRSSVIWGGSITGQGIAIDMAGARSPLVDSVVIHDASVGVLVRDTTGLTVTSSTINNADIGVRFDSSSSGVVSSSNLTYGLDGINISADSSRVVSVNNNFYMTVNPHTGRTPDETANNISLDPQYTGWFRIPATSPNIGAGTGAYDPIWRDAARVNRSLTATVDIGAYQYMPDATGSYVGDGDDYANLGGQMDPFRTLDRAMAVAQAAIEVDGGHLDAYYLSLRGVNVNLNRFSVATKREDVHVTYLTMTSFDISEKRAFLDGLFPAIDGTVIAVNVMGGGPQYLGTDFRIGPQYIDWNGLALDGMLSVGDTLRIVHPYFVKPLDTLTLTGHFSNIDVSRTVYVSPSGSDTTTVSGDGTRSHGDGSLQYPYRTVERAMAASPTGSSLVVLSGEYPLFDGTTGFVVIPVKDQTSVAVGGSVFEDYFAPADISTYNRYTGDPVYWDTTWSGDSSVQIGGGYLTLTYDGSDVARADSRFSLVGNFEASAELRNSLDPGWFKATTNDATIGFYYDDGTWVNHVYMGGQDYHCWGNLNAGSPDYHDFWTDYLCLSADDTRNGYACLEYMAQDTTSAVNVVGGPPQTYGVDYDLDGNHLVWRGLGMDGEVAPGDVIRVIYHAEGLANPVRVKLAVKNSILTVNGFDGSGWQQLMKRKLISDTDSTWSIGFSMDGTSEGHTSPVQRGKFFVSRFLATADSIDGAGESLMVKTDRRPAVFYDSTRGNPEI